MSIQKLKTKEFTLTIDESQCLYEIRPNLTQLTGKQKTIGALADDNAVHVETTTAFFDSKARGEVRIFDELLKNHIALSEQDKTRQFATKQSWQKKDDYIEWNMSIEHTEGKERELTVELILPQPVFPGSMGSGHANWHFWAAAQGAPYSPNYGLKQFHHCKCIDEETDIPLPLFTLYDPRDQSNLGFSLLLPPDQVWYTDFIFDQRNWLITVRFNNIALLENGKVNLKIWLFTHEGCYRPAIGWLRNKFPEFFAPMEGQEKVDGNMAYTVPLIPEKRVADWAEHMNYKWNELFHAREFGNYAPPEPFDSDHFATDEHPEWGVYGVTYEKINNYIEMCHSHGVNVMPYLNFGECESVIAERDFADSIVKTVTGETMVTWNYFDQCQHNILMNCDPAYSWCDAVIEQFRDLYNKLPGIDGFWFDQVGYGWIDTAHFDGHTFYHNQPAYNMSYMYIKALRKLRGYFPRPQFVGMGNAPVRWQLMEFLDGAMSEGSEEYLDRMVALCPERPTVLLAEGETAFQNAILYGSNLHVSPYYRYPTTEALPKSAVKLFKAYNPLMEFLQGRKWVYDPNPLTISWQPANIYQALINQPSDKLKGSIFRDPIDNYIISITAVTKGMMVNTRFIQNVEVKIRVKDGVEFKQAIIFGADYKGYYVEPVKQAQDGSLFVIVPKHGAATMIILTKDIKKLQGNKDWLKFREPRFT